MTRPAVSVVMPFAGDRAAARDALATLGGLRTAPGDELILADNAGVVSEPAPGVKVLAALGERSPAHARNAGAVCAAGEWILFLDADCRAPAGLIDAYFERPVASDVGALVGEVTAAGAELTVAARYGAQRSFLSQRAHLAHPFKPRAAAANLLVRRSAFEQVGGFFEGVRAAEDTDLTWRLQDAGWRIELREDAAVEHRYRATVAELRRQWRGYAAGRAWLARRYPGFVPEPALRRAFARALRRAVAGVGRRRPAGSPRPPRPDRVPPSGRLDRARFLALDALLGFEELAGLALSNRPRSPHRPGAAQAVLIAERFPAAGDPLVELARTLGRARVEAAARPRESDLAAARELAIEYREDDGLAARALAACALVLRHPVRCLRDALTRRGGGPRLAEIAPTVRRLERDPDARVLALGSESTRRLARRIAGLAGRRLEAEALPRDGGADRRARVA